MQNFRATDKIIANI